jgi:LemA protein
MKKTLGIIIAVVVLVLVYGFATYNNLVTLNIDADAKWKQVEVDYQRRFDLIPGLVESVKGVMKQETAVFSAIADARTRYAGATTPNDKAAAAGQVESALGRLLVITENYPELKSSNVMMTFMSQNEGTENRISVERMRFNEAVKAYNLKVMRIPSSVIAALTGFKERAYFEAAPGSEKAPEVKF